MDVTYCLFILITATMCVYGVRAECEYCPTNICLPLYTDTFVTTTKPVQIMPSLFGKRTIHNEGFYYIPCYRLCLQFLGQTRVNNGITYVKVSTTNIHLPHTYDHIWTPLNNARANHCTSQLHIAATTTSHQHTKGVTHHHQHHHPSTQKVSTSTGMTQSTTQAAKLMSTHSTHITKHMTAQTSGAALPSCDAIGTMADLMHHKHAENPNVEMCMDGRHGQSEAVIMNYCNATNTTTWYRGHQVVQHCPSLPLYTPVATFTTSKYHHDSRSFSGLFVGSCTANGFKMISQKCGGALEMIDVGYGTIIDANNYYVVHW